MTSLKILIFAIVVATAAAEPEPSEYLILDGIIRSVLENLRPSLIDLEVPKIVFNAETNLMFQLNRGLVKHLNEFLITRLSSSLLPLKVSNLTLTMDKIKLTGQYSLNGTLGLPIFPTDMKIYGDGDVRIDLKDVFFTIAANFVLNGGKAQIPPNGLYGFDFHLQDCQVDFKNLMGGGETGKIVNEYLGYLIPDIVRDYKYKVFEELKEPLREKLNEAMA